LTLRATPIPTLFPYTTLFRSDAQAHPRYRYFPETGEERFKSFLGVPIIHHRKVLGVLVVQQRESRSFDEGEEAFLVTISAQLAGVIAHGEATGVIGGRGLTGERTRDACFNGVAGASGVAVGRGIVVYPQADLTAVPDKTVEDVDSEVLRYQAAVEAVRNDMQALGEKLSVQLRPEEQALFDVYIRILDDSALSGEVISHIQKGLWAQSALKRVIQEYVRHFELMGDDYLRE